MMRMKQQLNSMKKVEAIILPINNHVSLTCAATNLSFCRLEFLASTNIGLLEGVIFQIRVIFQIDLVRFQFTDPAVL